MNIHYFKKPLKRKQGLCSGTVTFDKKKYEIYLREGKQRYYKDGEFLPLNERGAGRKKTVEDGLILSLKLTVPQKLYEATPKLSKDGGERGVLNRWIIEAMEEKIQKEELEKQKQVEEREKNLYNGERNKEGLKVYRFDTPVTPEELYMMIDTDKEDFELIEQCGADNYWGTKIILNGYYTEIAFMIYSRRRKPRNGHLYPPTEYDGTRAMVFDRKTEEGYSDSKEYWVDEEIPFKPFEEE